MVLPDEEGPAIKIILFSSFDVIILSAALAIKYSCLASLARISSSHSPFSIFLFNAAILVTLTSLNHLSKASYSLNSFGLS